MLKWRRVLLGTTLLSTLSVSSCATFANYIVPTLKDRSLRVDIESARTVFRYYITVPCGVWNLFDCRKEVLEYDFDFNSIEDRKKFNDMGFECSVPKRP